MTARPDSPTCVRWLDEPTLRLDEAGRRAAARAIALEREQRGRFWREREREARDGDRNLRREP